MRRTASVPCIVLRSRGERQISVTFSLRRENMRGMLHRRHVRPRRKPQIRWSPNRGSRVCTSRCGYTCCEMNRSVPRSILAHVRRVSDGQTARGSGGRLKAAGRRPPLFLWPSADTNNCLPVSLLPPKQLAMMNSLCSPLAAAAAAAIAALGFHTRDVSPTPDVKYSRLGGTLHSSGLM